MTLELFNSSAANGTLTGQTIGDAFWSDNGSGTEFLVNTSGEQVIDTHTTNTNSNAMALGTVPDLSLDGVTMTARVRLLNSGTAHKNLALQVVQDGSASLGGVTFDVPAVTPYNGLTVVNLYDADNNVVQSGTLTWPFLSFETVQIYADPSTVTLTMGTMTLAGPNTGVTPTLVNGVVVYELYGPLLGRSFQVGSITLAGVRL